ncbi:MAG TPA: ABC transporter permease [Patescibacteria group bacterium]|jgi:D-xylose transport system permease protein|nr:ABC transporter permease [Patescibacteria group bacterium]
MSESQDTVTKEKSLLLGQNTTQTLSQYARSSWVRMKSGDLGSLPILLGVVVIAIIFQSQNENYLTPRNFVNLMVQMSGMATIAIGVVFVLLLGEIDLSIGYVSAVTAVTMTLLLREPDAMAWYIALPLGLGAACLIGISQGLIITRFALPSFVVTLAGFLVWNGAVLILIGAAGTVIIQDKTVVGIANRFLTPTQGWAVWLIISLVFAVTRVSRWRSRISQGVSSTPGVMVVAQILFVSLILGIIVYICNLDRGVPLVGIILMILVLIFTFLASRTKFGRYVYAIGGNIEAARRAGINTQRIRVLVFMISSLMAGMGGIVLASRLRSVDTAAGGGNLLLISIAAPVIGGTSLFGGSGRVISAVLGALVIMSVENGMGLLGYSSGVKFVVTGLVLLVAVLIDAISRRSKAQSGIA